MFEQKLSRRQVRERRQAEADMREMLAAPAARRFLARLIDACGVFTLNPALDGRAEGRREIGLWLVAEINTVRPAAFAELQMEIVGRRLTDADDGEETDDE